MAPSYLTEAQMLQFGLKFARLKSPLYLNAIVQAELVTNSRREEALFWCFRPFWAFRLFLGFSLWGFQNIGLFSAVLGFSTVLGFSNWVFQFLCFSASPVSLSA